MGRRRRVHICPVGLGIGFRENAEDNQDDLMKRSTDGGKTNSDDIPVRGCVVIAYNMVNITNYSSSSS